MERAEAAESDVAELERGRGELTERLSALEAARDEAFARLDAEAAEVGRAAADRRRGGRRRPRGPLREDPLPSGGIGAAALRQRRCGGCQLELNPVEIQRIRSAPEDEVLRCEECRRILVRTAESGL